MIPIAFVGFEGRTSMLGIWGRQQVGIRPLSDPLREEAVSQYL